MMTLRQFRKGIHSIPLSTTWYLTDLGVALGSQELYTRQSPQRLKTLREHALIESAVSSNRIEGVQIDQARIGTVIFGKPLLRDRDEEEVRGYRQALDLVHLKGRDLPVNEATIQHLHALSRGEIWDAGAYKDKDGDIIEKYPDGRSRVRFKTVSAAHTSAAMKELLESYIEQMEAQTVLPLILATAFNLDFLCIHPFRDGNGRVSRLLLLLQTYHFGIEAGRYISLERLIEQNKDRYYETLEQSSHGWHQGEHDPWPYINFLLFILKQAYKEFEERLGETTRPKGEKKNLVLQAIDKCDGDFRVSDIQNKCPSVGMDMIRRVLKDLRAKKQVECLGRGQAARWRRTKTWQLGNTQ